MTASFAYQPSPCVPFRDLAEIERCRAIRREDIEKHSNPLFHISVQPVDDIIFTWIADMFQRVKISDDEDQATTLLLPNPCPDVYRKLAHLINRMQVDCRNLHVFALDEYANEEGVIAPEDWPFGFVNSLMESLYLQIEAPLRPPREQFIGPTNHNIDAYGTMIADLGGADACYTSTVANRLFDQRGGGREHRAQLANRILT